MYLSLAKMNPNNELVLDFTKNNMIFIAYVWCGGISGSMSCHLVVWFRVIRRLRWTGLIVNSMVRD